MSKTNKADRAVATIRASTRRDAAKVALTRTLSQTMPQSPDWGSATDVQNAVKSWSKIADAIDANAKGIANLRAQLKAAEAAQLGLRRDWGAAKSQVLSNVTLFCGGSVDRVKGFTLDVVGYGKVGALEAPANLAVNPGAQPGQVAASWSKGLATHGFLAQHATDPANAATISAPIASTKVKLTLGGLTPGATLSFRVAAIDPASPTGQTAWSAWVVGNAR
jgi:hypothetical protein